MQNLRQMRKTGIFRPGLHWLVIKTIIDTFTDGSSDHLLSVNVKMLLNFEGNFAQNVHGKQAF